MDILIVDELEQCKQELKHTLEKMLTMQNHIENIVREKEALDATMQKRIVDITLEKDTLEVNLQEALQNTQFNLQNMCLQKGKLEKRLMDVNSLNEQMGFENGELKRNLEEAVSKLGMKEQLMRDSKSTINELEQNIQAMHIENAALRDEKSILQERNQGIQASVEWQQEQIHQSVSEMNDLKHIHEETLEELHTKNAQLAELNSNDKHSSGWVKHVDAQEESVMQLFHVLSLIEKIVCNLEVASSLVPECEEMKDVNECVAKLHAAIDHATISDSF